jgi:hypothetical protein
MASLSEAERETLVCLLKKIQKQAAQLSSSQPTPSTSAVLVS